MSILDKLTARPLYRRRFDDFEREPIAFVSEKMTGNLDASATFYPRDEYELTATISVRYWANPADHHRARQDAETKLAAALYGDFLLLLTEAQAAVSNGDRQAASRAISELRAMIVRQP